MNLGEISIQFHAPQQFGETLVGTQWIVERIARNQERVYVPLFAGWREPLRCFFLMTCPQMLARESYCRYVIASFPVTPQPIESLRSYSADSPVDGLLGVGRAESGDKLCVVGQEHCFCPLFDRCGVFPVPLVGIAECFTDGGVVGIENGLHTNARLPSPTASRNRRITTKKKEYA
jgi:hypothetical protein